jgi:hypothetical protein
MTTALAGTHDQTVALAGVHDQTVALAGVHAQTVALAGVVDVFVEQEPAGEPWYWRFNVSTHSGLIPLIGGL